MVINNWFVFLLNKSVFESIIILGYFVYDLDLVIDINEDMGKDGNEILLFLKGDVLMDSIDEVDYFDSED